MSELSIRGQHQLFLRRVGVTLLCLSLFYAYGVAATLMRRIYLRTNGIPVQANILKWEQHPGRVYPLISFRLPDGEESVHRAMDGYLPGTVPPVDSHVEARYDPERPDRVLLKLKDGAAQYEWLLTPGLLALLFLSLLVTGLRLVMV